MSQPIIQIKDLYKSYPSKNGPAVALENINLDIYPGEIFGIIGLSGAGKSTLVRCINFLEKPTSGTVIFDNLDLSKLSHKELCKARQSMGMIFQQFNLLMQRIRKKTHKNYEGYGFQLFLILIFQVNLEIKYLI